MSKAFALKSVNCLEVDIGELLNLHGDAYELEYIDPEHTLGVDIYLDQAVNIILTANLVMFVVALLARSSGVPRVHPILTRPAMRSLVKTYTQPFVASGMWMWHTSLPALLCVFRHCVPPLVVAVHWFMAT